MITEQYVTFETARLLKEAGFNCRVKRYFRMPDFSSEPKEMSLLNAMNINMEPMSYSCPTQALAARWLREIHNLHVKCHHIHEVDKWYYDVTLISHDHKTWNTCMEVSGVDFSQYEECFEKGLQDALRLIIIKNKEKEKDNVR